MSSSICTCSFKSCLLKIKKNSYKKRNCIDKKLVERVDNYALLNMDIIWCYLNLQNLHELKNAGIKNKITDFIQLLDLWKQNNYFCLYERDNF